MSTRVETRRSSKKSEPSTVVNGNTYGTRSAIKSHLQPKVLHNTAPITKSKRQSGTSPQKSPSAERRRSSLAVNENKRAKLEPVTASRKSSQETTTLSKDDTTSPTATVDTPVANAKKKLTPAMARMKVLQERFANVITAILKSEAMHIDFQIDEIKKGTCPRFKEATKPLKDNYERRLTIAEKRMELQKAQADREWLGARTIAQYAFANERADLRSRMMQRCSQQQYDIKREHHEMSVQKDTIEPLYKSILHPLHEILAPATDNEKDADLLLMRMSTSQVPVVEARASMTSPSLDSSIPTASDEAAVHIDESQSTEKRSVHRPQQKKRRLEPANGKEHLPDTTTTDSSNLPSISSLLATEEHSPLDVAVSNTPGIVAITPRLENDRESAYGIYEERAMSRPSMQTYAQPQNSPVPQGLNQSAFQPQHGMFSPAPRPTDLEYSSSMQHSSWPPQAYPNSHGYSGTVSNHLLSNTHNSPQIGYKPQRENHQSYDPRYIHGNNSFYAPSNQAPHEVSAATAGYSDLSYELISNNAHTGQAVPPPSSYPLPPRDNQMLPPLSLPRPTQAPASSNLLHPFRRTELSTSSVPFHNTPTNLSFQPSQQQPATSRYDQASVYSSGHAWRTSNH